MSSSNMPSCITNDYPFPLESLHVWIVRLGDAIYEIHTGCEKMGGCTLKPDMVKALASYFKYADEKHNGTTDWCKYEEFASALAKIHANANDSCQETSITLERYEVIMLSTFFRNEKAWSMKLPGRQSKLTTAVKEQA
ncbi:uncharacterized protein DSM5745_05745 [Aspergillus mulundensis]|uniref:Uncharacterized protein n=1 Tax=Aspergillus mulundensis TaxID=1810919 RepID=A0A3D8RXV6_9EURO|nr:hypothetical protein DSM5745_05745 [Aspergillus mulundensis]RDW78893.1 hypothetical protein DSM5745_05745 [Aspergillus mulundensis]